MSVDPMVTRAEDRVSPEVAARFEAFVEEARLHHWGHVPIEQLASSKPILEGTEREKVETVIAAMSFFHRRDEAMRGRRGGWTIDGSEYAWRTLVAALVSRLLRNALPFTAIDLALVLETVVRSHGIHVRSAGIVKTLERHAHDIETDARLRDAVRSLHDRFGAYEPKLATRLQVLLGAPRAPALSIVAPVDAWTHALARHLEAVAVDVGALVAHCGTLSSTRPSKKWLATAEATVDALGRQRHTALMTAVLAAIGDESPVPLLRFDPYTKETYELDPRMIADASADLLRGLVWSSLVGDTPELVGPLGDAAVRCFKKIAHVGPLSPKIGNACSNVLAASGLPSAVAQLSRLRTSVKHASARAQIKKAFDAAADASELASDDLEELAVPDCGLTDIGERTETFGEFTARLRIVGSTAAELTWHRVDGKAQASVPARVASDHADDLAALRKAAKELETMLPAQRDRIERLLRSGRTIPFEAWKARYWDQRLVGPLVRRLIWRFGPDGPLGTADGARIVDRDGNEVAPPRDCPVSLWHPIESEPETVLAWREQLADRGVTQPFKQAHREIYLATEAERRTDSYSNRFAAHILRQHQFRALCQQRGWRYTLMGSFDSHNTPTLDVPDAGWRVEFCVRVPEGLEATTQAGIYSYVATDRVQFFHLHEDGPRRIEEVPPLLFSELMRDVDLFVGVCSVGNDPSWRDGGGAGRYVEYWHRYAFGDLSQSARTRRDALMRLVPMLAIAERCTLSEKFLVVRGELRSYKIHLGSGNILMTPNDEYLCIVPDRKSGAARHVMLPFEGDGMLSTILSKAFLLADDAKIEDRTILDQIKR